MRGIPGDLSELFEILVARIEQQRRAVRKDMKAVLRNAGVNKVHVEVAFAPSGVRLADLMIRIGNRVRVVRIVRVGRFGERDRRVEPARR